jgi:hypothetical protein
MAAKRENKTKPTAVSPLQFVKDVEHPQRRADGLELLKLFSDVTGEKPVMWGPTIVGYGKISYRYATGHSGEVCMVGFSPRKANLVFYVGTNGASKLQLAKLGKHRTSGGGCLYINKLDDVDREVLRQLIKDGYEDMRAKAKAGVDPFKRGK